MLISLHIGPITYSPCELISSQPDSSLGLIYIFLKACDVPSITLAMHKARVRNGRDKPIIKAKVRAAERGLVCVSHGSAEGEAVLPGKGRKTMEKATFELNLEECRGVSRAEKKGRAFQIEGTVCERPCRRKHMAGLESAKMFPPLIYLRGEEKSVFDSEVSR